MTADSDRLYSMLYSSTAAEAFDDAQLAGLLAQSRASNSEQHLTGMLLYRAGRFIQVLEGPERVVRELIGTIGRDPRHTGMRVLMEEPLGERHFAEWTMGYEPISELSDEVPEGFRSTFADLESADDASATVRAARELSLWFRVRARTGR